MSVDKETLAVYAAQADRYTSVEPTEAEQVALDGFLARLPPRAEILDIGCGPGVHALAMQNAGFAVTAWDASPEFVDFARAQGIDAELGTYDDLTTIEAFDAIWASFSLLHTPKADHPKHIKAMARALRPGGWLYIGMKVGDGEARDRLGRFYSYVTRAELEELVKDAGLDPAACVEGEGIGLAGTVDAFILLTSQRVA